MRLWAFTLVVHPSRKASPISDPRPNPPLARVESHRNSELRDPDRGRRRGRCHRRSLLRQRSSASGNRRDPAELRLIASCEIATSDQHPSSDSGFVLGRPRAGHDHRDWSAEPMLYVRSTGLSPISVVISVIFWTWLWGPVGLILATPLTLCLVVLGQHVKQLEFLNVLFGDRPALTSVENFYQRVLAGDLDELQEHAEDLLKKMSLSSYYDEVALKGLELAAHDVVRGVLTTAQLEHIHDIIAELIDALSDYDDVEPTEQDDRHYEAEDKQDKEAEKIIPLKPARRQATAMNIGETRVEEESAPGSEQGVVCVASRGPLDEAAGMMLAQILGKHSLKTNVVKHQAVSRSQIDQLHCDDAAVICICYIDAGDSTSQLRYLIRRLRQRVPTARLLVAIWPSDHPVRVQKERQESLGANYYVSSVRAAVDLCLEASAAFAKKTSAVSN